MGAKDVRYEADALPQDSVPVWTKTEAGSPSESVSNGILTTSTGANENIQYSRYESPFKRGDIHFRARRLSGGAAGSFNVMFKVMGTSVGVRFQALLDVIYLDVGGLSTSVSVDVDNWHEYRLQMVTIGGGYPKAHLFVDGVKKASLTSDVPFTPNGVRLLTSSVTAMSADVDYVRYRLMGASDRRQRMDGMEVNGIEKKKLKDMYFTYPGEGGTKSVAKGDLVIDFWCGEVRVPGEDDERISGKLEGSGHDYCRAVFIDHPDQDVNVSLDGGGKFEIKAETMRGVIFQEFRTLKIVTTTTTAIRVFASTNPRGGIVAA